MIEWKDATSYSRVDKDRIPRVWEYIITDGKSIKISVIVHKHIDTGDDWNLTCRELGINMKTLKSTEIDEAKSEAIKLIYQKLLEKSVYYKCAAQCVEYDSGGNLLG